MSDDKGTESMNPSYEDEKVRYYARSLGINGRKIPAHSSLVLYDAPHYAAIMRRGPRGPATQVSSEARESTWVATTFRGKGSPPRPRGDDQATTVSLVRSTRRDNGTHPDLRLPAFPTRLRYLPARSPSLYAPVLLFLGTYACAASSHRHRYTTVPFVSPP